MDREKGKDHRVLGPRLIIYGIEWIGDTLVVIGADGKELSAKYISLNFDEANWTEKNGYYYYNGTVKPGQETEPLFTKVSFSKDMPNEYMNARVEIEVDADVVQSKNNSGSALEASGWTDNEFAE